MENFASTPGKIVQRLRWLMIGVILFDMFNSALGQPGSYWHHPETANEANHLFRYFMVQGPVLYLSFQLVYLAVAFLVASRPCKRGALFGIFAYIFGHYYGGSSWLVHRWHFGAAGFVIYGIALAAAIVLLAFPSPDGVTSKP